MMTSKADTQQQSGSKSAPLHNSVEKASLSAPPGNIFMVSARDFYIIHGENPRYWQWPRAKETSDMMVEVAELRAVCWLEIRVKFEMGRLTPGINYEVVYVVMIKAYNRGWRGVPVTIILSLPDGSKQIHKEDFSKKPRSKWFEIPVGEFIVDAKKGGSVEFSMFEYDSGGWKSGLVIKGAIIRPKF